MKKKTHSAKKTVENDNILQTGGSYLDNERSQPRYVRLNSIRGFHNLQALIRDNQIHLPI